MNTIMSPGDFSLTGNKFVSLHLCMLYVSVEVFHEYPIKPSSYLHVCLCIVFLISFLYSYDHSVNLNLSKDYSFSSLVLLYLNAIII